MKRLSAMLFAVLLLGSAFTASAEVAISAGMSGFPADRIRVIEASREETIRQIRITYSPDATELLEIEGSIIKDLDRDGELDVYEDWRKSTEKRAHDLLEKLSLKQKAALLFVMDMTDYTGGEDITSYELSVDNADLRAIVEKGVTAFRICMPMSASLAAYWNALQVCAEASGMGIPVTLVPAGGETGTALSTVVADETRAALQLVLDQDTNSTSDPVKALILAAENGVCDETLIDSAALDVLKNKIDSGLFEDPYLEEGETFLP